MKIDNLSEVFWRKIKYVLLFILSVLVLYIIQTKYIFKVPKSNNKELLGSINEYETILNEQVVSAEKIKLVHEKISKMEFDIHMVQSKDDVRKEINEIYDIYLNNNRDSKYLFGKQSSNILQIYFDINEEESSLKNNVKNLTLKLNECKAGILNENK
jgi:ribosomal protein L23